jgi:hypothetical protein
MTATELFATCRAEKPCGLHLFVFDEAEKERREKAHLTVCRNVTDANAVAALMTADPSHDADVQTVVEAIEYDAAQHDGEVDPNRVRGLLPAHVQPQVVGSTYNVLIAKGRLEKLGWVTNLDRHGRNFGKPIMSYRLVAS